ncbi:extracellular catalytic domain type 1 short-chain-length polyhydroxyalkanoate depolymerase [Beijerinckia indica]|uniref:Esterase, PHB depolymerase family n=1 Tax=Beijerinckia indica subsp. indica (strain ATCC 9039 / DSM 1715 / NCIMB 8712) TaxID=395963 RepID=B2IGW6_BEII9|nr:PHB depolymerase family esterase [Beijerinckia indica]ACB97212.1 esterase, PHB depolymerase family [Beijerinckia indica subsp. indica ATCC 9039]
MVGLGKTIFDLSHFHRQWENLWNNDVQRDDVDESFDRLWEIEDFGSNPGNLRMLIHVPEDLPPNPALVVVLHGCSQTAAGYDHGTGWSRLADQQGFVLVYPEQRRANNPKSCFSWFDPGDMQRDMGEPLSIRQMIEKAVVDHKIDRSRIFINGLSAGGAMTNIMLATYPEVFAAGAIIAGLPYGAATNMHEALRAMFEGAERDAEVWGDLVRTASEHKGAWPRISIWHGTSDRTVKFSNAAEILKQWHNLHGLETGKPRYGRIDGYTYRGWHAASGAVLVEDYQLDGMAHGVPLDVQGENSRETSGSFLLDVGISSTSHIARFFGLMGSETLRHRVVQPPIWQIAGGPLDARLPPVDRAVAVAKPGKVVSVIGKTATVLKF